MQGQRLDKKVSFKAIDTGHDRTHGSLYNNK